MQNNSICVAFLYTATRGRYWVLHSSPQESRSALPSRCLAAVSEVRVNLGQWVNVYPCSFTLYSQLHTSCMHSVPASSWTSVCLSAGGDAANYLPPGVHLCCIYVCVCQNRRAGGQIIWVYGLEQQCWVAEERLDGVLFLRHMDSGRWLIPATLLFLACFFVVTIFADE